MKTPEEWVKVYADSPHYNVTTLVREVQKEAYNEAIKDATKSVNQVALDHVSIEFLKQSISKLKL